MKNLCVFTLVIFSSINALSQGWELGSDFNFAQPVGGMTRTMNNAFGLTLDFARKFKGPVSLGVEVGVATYGLQTSRQSYQFDDGSITETDVNVSNDLFNFHVTGKYYLRNGKNINPYLSAKLGMALFTTMLTIEDPEDEYACHPLESDVLSSDNTYSAGLGAGVRMDFQTIFKNIEREKFFLDLNVHSTQGGTVRYMNADRQPSQTADEEVTARFLNTQTQVIHEHHVGNLYTSVLSLVEYRLGVIFRF